MPEAVFAMFSQISFPGSSLLISVAGFVGVILCLHYALACRGLWNLKTPGHQETPIQPDELHPEVRRHLQPWLDRLAGFGFAGPVYRRLEPCSIVERVACRVMEPKTKCVAELRILILPSGAAPRITLGFYTFLSDGRFLATGETGYCEHLPAHWIGLFKRFKTIQGHWETHLSRLESLAPLATAVSPEDPAGAMATEHMATDLASVKAGMLERDPANEAGWRVRRIGIPWHALKVVKYSLPGFKVGSTRRTDLAPPAPAQPGAAGSLPPTLGQEDPVERDLKKYHEAAGGKKGMGGWAKLALLAVTLGLFAVFWKGGDLGGITSVIIGVLLLHEFGHWLPMKLFGYKNVTMFFIPGFGAAVSGKKQHAPAWQDLVVLLGGPVPGLFGGIALMVAGYFRQDIPDFWLNAAGLAVIINAFNLLPFLPLDGGKVVDLLVFKDIPLLRLLFNGFSTLTVIVVCFLPGMGVMRYLAIIMVLGLIRDVKMFGVLREAGKVDWAGQVDDEDTALRRIFKELRDGGNANFVGSPDWLARTQVVVEEVLRKRPGWLMRIGGLGVYGAVCLFPFLLIAAFVAVSIGGSLSKSPGGGQYLAGLREDLPKSATRLSQEQLTPLNKLSMTTEVLLLDAEDESPGMERVRRIAESLPEETCREVDFVHWEHVRDFQSLGDPSMETVDVWLETACLRMERATDDGKSIEGFRRTEIMLHAIQSLEPAISHRQREQLWDVQIRVLKNFAKLNGTGAITPAMQDRLKPRIQALRNRPNPAVEAFLLMDGWTERELQQLISDYETEYAGDTPQDDAAFCRNFYKQIDELRGSPGKSPPTVLAVAQFWKKEGKACELPEEMPTGVKVTPAEAEFLHRFCDRKREITWLQNATLHAMNLDAYQKQHGRLPERWNQAIPGGGMVAYVSGTGPSLCLTDARSEAQRAGPAWLGRTPDELQASLNFPLRPVADKSGASRF